MAPIAEPGIVLAKQKASKPKEAAPKPKEKGKGKEKVVKGQIPKPGSARGLDAARDGDGRGRGKGREPGRSLWSGLGPTTLRTSALMGSLTKEEVLTSGKAAESWPEAPPVAAAFASNTEYDSYVFDKKLARKLKSSPYYVLAPDAGKTHFDTYAARKAREQNKGQTFADQATKDLLNPEFFPPSLWDMIFDPKKRKPKKKKKPAPRPKLNLDKVAEGAENEEDQELFRPGSDEEQDNMTESEEEGANDYEANYFDNGEDDDEGGAEGDGDEAEL